MSDEPGWRTAHNRRITELRFGHGRWRTTSRHEHDRQTSRELALDRHRRAGQRDDRRLRVDRPRWRDGTNASNVPTSAFQFSRCMRANGVPNFPDPDANGNIQFPITSPIPKSPAFQRAQSGACKKYLNNR
jgi:hypothetical protein